jgi:hypothetical protein
MSTYKCRYGRTFCGGIHELCADCEKDAEAARKNPGQAPLKPLAEMSGEELRAMKAAIMVELERRERVTIRIPGIRLEIKF